VVEECQVDGAADRSCDLLGLFAGGDGLWVAWMVEVCWLSWQNEVDRLVFLRGVGYKMGCVYHHMAFGTVTAGIFVYAKPFFFFQCF